MVNIVAGAVIVVIVGLAIRYIYKEKKKGTHCIGCPMAGNCHKYGKANKEKPC
ncbi:MULTISPECIES: FeoB-associated Cys-rich membrane protein [unclassified Butyrivibrio]|uniref:FeoB-associated Cys-rich membrane protein n=1 Tax=unclassified Butyrivibrio TaxID=2639466 RepID=UPI0004268387|nr:MULTISPECIES: FeoB-associated Cys-rich membrane protein [unclassified Butyrivibrio]